MARKRVFISFDYVNADDDPCADYEFQVLLRVSNTPAAQTVLRLSSPRPSQTALEFDTSRS